MPIIAKIISDSPDDILALIYTDQQDGEADAAAKLSLTHTRLHGERTFTKMDVRIMPDMTPTDRDEAVAIFKKIINERL